ncbi:hypothetical protein Droror1_Dr00016484 [Drosera rotundifolia]
MSQNDFYGTIPQELFCDLRSLEYIDLSGNDLPGELPKNIGQAVNTKTLVQSDNYFYGSRSKSFANLSSLLNLDLSGNNLWGTISPILRPNNSSETLDLSINQFSGPIIPTLFGPNITGGFPTFLVNVHLFHS